MGRYDISLEHLTDIISNHSKFDHNLVVSDLYVKDRQNYSSCEKISSPPILNILSMNSKTSATYCYLSVIRYIILAYIDRSTSILDRIRYAWKSVFICRCWYAWVHARPANQTHRKQRSRSFITEPALFSIELNAHTLLFILLLVLDKRLPAESLNIFLFSSQPCENFFRSARSLNGSFSSMTNFSVYQFLKKSHKVSILNSIKTHEQSSADQNRIKFPTHRKQQQNFQQTQQPSLIMNQITIATIEEIILDSYHCAISFMDQLEISDSLKSNKVYDLKDLCDYIRDQLTPLDNTSQFPDSHLNEELKHTGNYTDIVDPLLIWSDATN